MQSAASPVSAAEPTPKTEPEPEVGEDEPLADAVVEPAAADHEDEGVAPARAGGRYGPVMRRRLKKFLAIVETDEGWEDRGEVAYSVSNGADAKLQHWGRVGDLLMIRFSGEIAAPAAAVWDIVRDGSRRSELDELLDNSKKLEDLSQLISVWQFDFKPVMMTAPRSFVTIGFSVQLPDGRLVCFSFSVEHPDASDPEPTGHVRADLGLAGYLIEPLEDSKCKLTVVMRLDLGGSLMDWIREKAAKDQHENMVSLVGGLLGPNAARPVQEYVACGEQRSDIPNAPESSREAYAQLEALGKALLEGGSARSLQAEEEEGLGEWEKETGAPQETIASSVGSFMKSLW